MRFHVGVSFRLKNLVKFIIPILIGIGAYFGLPVLFGFIPKVNALVNLNTSYDFTIEEDLPSSLTDTFNSIIEDFNGASSDYTFAIVKKENSSYIYTFPKSSFTSVYVFKQYFYVTFDLNYSTFFYLEFDNSVDVVNTVGYSDFLNCYINNEHDSCLISDTSNIYVGTGSANPTYIDMDLGNDDNLTGTLLDYYYYIESPQYYYINSSNSSNSDVFYKSLYINGELVEEGDPFPTYYSLFVGSDDPIPPEPSDTSIIDYTYWFYDNLTEYDILINIYVLMFYYFMINLFFKFIGIIRGVNW